MNAIASSRLLLRTDASPEIGTGHAMRCLALAQAWQDAGGEADFASAEMPVSLVDRLDREDCRLVRLSVPIGSPEDADHTARHARACGAGWVVVDGYRFSPAYFATLREHGLQVLAIDDMAHLDHYPVALLLNQNLGAHAGLYGKRLDRATPRLLGPHFSLLRREFRRTPPRDRSVPNRPCRLMVTFGGADVENFTAQVLHNLFASSHRDIEVVVLAGAANPHVAALREFAAAAPFACEIRVASADVAAVIGWADAAISAAGSTVWELASLRCPALIGAHEANQLAGLAALRTVAGFRVWTVEELLNRDLGAELATLPAVSGSDFDARGAERVVAHLLAMPAPTVPELSAV